MKDIYLAAHSTTALNTHANGLEHRERLSKVDSQSFIKNNKAAAGTAAAKRPESSFMQSSFHSFTNRIIIINVKIKWALDVVILTFSFNSSSNKNEVFAAIFFDSEVAKAFSCV